MSKAMITANAFIARCKGKITDESVLFEALSIEPHLCTPTELNYYRVLIERVKTMTGGERDTIKAAFLKGPIEDGDVPSKAARDRLMLEGFIVKVVVKGEQGFNACTYQGSSVYRLLSAGA